MFLTLCVFMFHREYGLNCRLKERIEENGYNTYSSARWKNRRRSMFVGLNANGRPLKGRKTRRKNTATHFLPIMVWGDTPTPKSMIGRHKALIKPRLLQLDAGPTWGHFCLCACVCVFVGLFLDITAHYNPNWWAGMAIVQRYSLKSNVPPPLLQLQLISQNTVGVRS